MVPRSPLLGARFLQKMLGTLCAPLRQKKSEQKNFFLKKGNITTAILGNNLLIHSYFLICYIIICMHSQIVITLTSSLS